MATIATPYTIPLPGTTATRAARLCIALGAACSAPLAAAAPPSPAPSVAPPLPPPLVPGGSGEVTQVIDGDTLLLADGRQVRLVGLRAPKPPLGRAGQRPWPLAEAAAGLLGRLSLGQRVTLGYGGLRLDRHRRALAHLFDEDGRWLQGALLAAGLARADSTRDNRALAARMLALEEAARAAGRGLWAVAFYAPRDPVSVAGDVGSFQLVEGLVVSAAKVRGRVYLNFGADWKSDFTVTLAPEIARLFEAEGVVASDYQGRRLRVRGWIKSFNGPMIEASHPEQIELLP